MTTPVDLEALGAAWEFARQDSGYAKQAAWCQAHGRALISELTAARALLEEAGRVLEPFAKIAGPIKGEAGRPTYLEAIMGPDPTDELAVTTIFDTGGRGAVLWADDFRAARAFSSKLSADTASGALLAALDEGTEVSG